MTDREIDHRLATGAWTALRRGVLAPVRCSPATTRCTGPD
jgi:hypothetical protein